MVHYVQRLVESRGRGAEEYAERMFHKGLKYDVFRGDVLGYCALCDKWYNQTRSKNCFCPTHKRLLTNQKYAERTVRTGKSK